MRCIGAAIAYPILNAIFNSKISANLGPSIAVAVLPLGLSPKVLPAFIGAIAASDQEALMQILGVTPEIVSAGVHGLQLAYVMAFRGVWITSAAVSAAALIGLSLQDHSYTPPLTLPFSCIIYHQPRKRF
jgi:hypothetical protein